MHSHTLNLFKLEKNANQWYKKIDLEKKDVNIDMCIGQADIEFPLEVRMKCGDKCHSI